MTMLWVCFLYLLQSTLVAYVVLGDEAFVKSLYSPDDPILELDFKNFNDSLFHKPKAFFVEFYSSWCGHCIAFAPLWKELATEVVGWRDVVEIAAVNCALDANFNLCQEHSIDGYPTLKYFKYQSSTPADGQSYTYGKDTPLMIMNGIARHVIADYEQQKPPTWPDMSLAHDSKPGENLWHEDTQYLALVFETYPPPGDTKSLPPVVGIEAALDFASAKGVLVRRATSSHTLARAHDINQSPGLLVFSRTQANSPVYISRESLTRRDILTKIRYHTHLATQAYDRRKGGSNVMVEANANSVIENASKSRYFVHYTDIMSALTYMFTHEIPTSKRISGEKLKALKQFMEILTRYFPGSEPVKRLLFRMISWLNTQTEAITSDDWFYQLKSFQEQLGRPLSGNVSWVSCKGSSPKYRGYPCSLWTTFHTLTVNAYKMDSGRRDFKPVEVLQAIRGYLQHFFGCRKCVENFERSAVRLDAEVKKASDVVVWLWRAHNRANNFLSGDPSEDPEHKKQQFPPVSMCANCRHADDSWDESHVLEFLLKFYSNVQTETKNFGYQVSNNQKPGETEQKVLETNTKFRTVSWESLVEKERLEKMQELENRLLFNHGQQARSDGLLSSFDLTLCFGIWLSSMALLVVFCAYVKYRKSKHRFWKTLYGDLKV